MYLNHKKLIKYNYIALLLSKLYQFFNPFSKNQLRILIYHHIENEQFNLFRKQIKFLKKKNWNFITQKQFELHISAKKKLKGKNILLTFDDGFYSNYLVAKKILNKLNIKAIFFVPSDFIKIKKNSTARYFIKKNILDQEIPKDFQYIKNMNFKNLKTLVKNGHYIGSHSKTHVNLGLLSNDKILKKEIIQSTEDLEKKLKLRINHFAFTYGNYQSISNKSLKIAKTKFNYIYSSLRGNNFSNYQNEIIKRDAIYIKEKNSLITIFLSGLIDIKYLFQLNRINKFINMICK